MKVTKIVHILFILVLPLIASSNAFAEVPDAFTPAWADFRFKNQNLSNIQSPIEPGQVRNESVTGNGQFLLAQNQASEIGDTSTTSEESSVFFQLC
jgi:hypothetical protein